MSAADEEALAARLVVRTLPTGAAAFGGDGWPDGVWVIRDGAIELVTGDGRLVAQVLRDGDVFGDVPLLIGRRPPYQPRAGTVTTGLWLAAGEFLPLVSERPALGRVWLSSCARRFFDSQQRSLALLEGALPKRAARLLLSEARAGVVALPQVTLAAMLGIPRPSLNRVLRGFERAGLIKLHYRSVFLLSEERLRHAAFDG